MADRGQAPSDPSNPPDLQIEQDLPFQRRTWIVQRIGWAVMLAIVAAALAGLFSNGPLSRAQATDPEGMITVAYERFARYEAPTELRLRLEPPSTGQDTVTIRMSRSLTQQLDLERIRPEPERMTAASDGMHFTFNIAEKGKSADLVFSVRPRSIGSLRGEIGVVGREPARLSQFIYP